MENKSNTMENKSNQALTIHETKTTQALKWGEKCMATI